MLIALPGMVPKSMTNFYITVFLISVSTCFLACGDRKHAEEQGQNHGESSSIIDDSNSSDDSINEPASVAPTSSEVNINDLKELYDSFFQRSRVECDIDGGCPMGSGLVVMTSESQLPENRLSRCSGFLVAPNILATNSHCIPDDIKEGASCQRRIGVKFPASRYRGRDIPAESAHCQRIIYSSPIVEINGQNDAIADYAFIELDHPLREHTPFRISPRGVRSGESLQIIRMMPSSRFPGGKIQAISGCLVERNSLITRNYDNDSNPIEAVSSCRASFGNSGSAVLNSNGDVAGIFQGVISRLYLQNMNLSPLPITESQRSLLRTTLVFSTFACFAKTITGEDRERPKSCNFQFSENPSEEAIQRAADRALVDLTTRSRAIQQWTQRSRSGLRWKRAPITQQNSTQHMNHAALNANTINLIPFTPHCFEPQHLWPAFLRRRLSETTGIMRFLVNVPSYQFISSISPYLQYHLNFRRIQMKSISIFVDAQQLKSAMEAGDPNQTVPFQLSIEPQESQESEVLQTQQLSLCQ